MSAAVVGRVASASVPENRWLKNTEYAGFFLNQTTHHYAARTTDLAAVLAATTSAAV